MKQMNLIQRDIRIQIKIPPQIYVRQWHNNLIKYIVNITRPFFLHYDCTINLVLHIYLILAFVIELARRQIDY